MDFATIATTVGSLGFPIVACLAMAWYVKYQMDENNKQVKTMTEEHRSEMKEVTQALNNNTIAIEKLCTIIGDKENEVE